MGGLFGSKTPKAEPVQRMPDAEDPALKEAKRRAAASASARSGRASTVMSRTNRATTDASASSGTAYRNSFLGSAT